MTTGSVSLRLPGGWESLPVDRDGMLAAVDEMVDKVRASAPDVAPDEEGYRNLRAMFGKIGVEAADAGVIFAAGYIEAVEGEILLSATAAMISLDGRDMGMGAASVTAPMIMAALTEPAPGSRRLRPPAYVDTAAGRAVEVSSIERVDGVEQTDVYVDTYVLPAINGNGVIVCAFRTPCLALSDQFHSLFRSIASTIELAVDDDQSAD
jgi:hypothetical protein